jgi:hypothetical protein
MCDNFTQTYLIQNNSLEVLQHIYRFIHKNYFSWNLLDVTSLLVSLSSPHVEPNEEEKIFARRFDNESVREMQNQLWMSYRGVTQKVSKFTNQNTSSDCKQK